MYVMNAYSLLSLYLSFCVCNDLSLRLPLTIFLDHTQTPQCVVCVPSARHPLP